MNASLTRLVSIASFVGLVSACSTANLVSISSVPLETQTAYFTQGSPALASLGSQTSVMVAAYEPQYQAGERISFLATINNSSNEMLDVLVQNISLVDETGHMLHLYTVQELISEFETASRNARIGRGLQGFGAGISGDPAQQAQVQRNVAIERQNTESNLLAIEQSTLVNQTLFPGETINGLIVAEPPNVDDLPKIITLRIVIGDDTHEVSFVHVPQQ